VTAPERDPRVARALADLEVPDHRPGFWEDLARDVAAEAALLHDLRPADDELAEPPPRLPTSELPAVRPLAHRRPRRTPWLAVAAGLIVLAGAVGFTLAAGDGDGDDSELAGEPPESTTDTAATLESDVTTTATTPTTTTPTTEPPAGDTADGAVGAFLQALAEGDAATAAGLLGPRSQAYITAIGGTPEGLMQESQEGFGAWVDAPDLTVAAVEIGPTPIDAEGQDTAFVVVSGTYTGEGSTGYRVDVFPAVKGPEGWRVEHLAHSPDHDNEPVFTLPTLQEDGNLGGMNPDDDINVFLPTSGVVVFQVDGGELATKTTSIVAGDPFALYNPPTDLSPGTHTLVVVAFGDDGTITHFAGTFVVEA
jgi:hypothetical protein